jgi:hypothetical protein
MNKTCVRNHMTVPSKVSQGYKLNYLFTYQCKYSSHTKPNVNTVVY